MEEYTQDELDEARELEAAIEERIIPAIVALEEEFEGGGACFGIYINMIHSLLSQGWTKEELIDEVQTHYEIHANNNLAEGTGGFH